jgi:hypothetical protein
MKDKIALAIEHTTGPGDPLPNPYRIASWLSAMYGYWSPFMMGEIRAYLGAPDIIDSAITEGIGSLLEDARKQGTHA